MAHWGVYVVGICEPISPGGHGAWGAAITGEGQSPQKYGGYLGRKKEMNVIYATVFGFVQAGRIVRHLAQPGDTMSICTVAGMALEFIKGEKKMKDWDDLIPLLKRFRTATDGLQATIGTISKEWAKDAEHNARQAVWDAIKKWPAPGKMMDHDPAVAEPMVKPKVFTLDDFGEA